MQDSSQLARVEQRATAKAARYKTVIGAEGVRIIQFKGATLLSRDGGPYRPMGRDDFARLMYELFTGIKKQDIAEVDDMVRMQAPDHTQWAHLIRFGDQVWDATALDWVADNGTAVYASPVSPTGGDTTAARAYLRQLADGDDGLADDMLQAMAPLFMTSRPAGVVWFIGMGANGKSALLDALYRIIGTHLVSLTMGAIEDGRDTPRLNGALGNVCKESSEGRVSDTERYKALGTHEDFWVHKFHSQDTVRVDANLHTIFNANNIPVFGDKTQGARRRTLIIPFPARFRDDPGFEDRTFTPAFLSGLLMLILEATQKIKRNGYQYAFSDVTVKAKEAYDSEVNSAEAYLNYLKEQHVEAFTNYHLLRINYVNWCDDNGLVALGTTTLKRVMTQLGAVEYKTVRVGDSTRKWYVFGYSTTRPSEMVTLDNGLNVGLKVSQEVEAELTVNRQQELGDGW